MYASERIFRNLVDDDRREMGGAGARGRNVPQVQTFPSSRIHTREVYFSPVERRKSITTESRGRTSARGRANSRSHNVTDVSRAEANGSGPEVIKV